MEPSQRGGAVVRSRGLVRAGGAAAAHHTTPVACLPHSLPPWRAVRAAGLRAAPGGNKPLKPCLHRRGYARCAAWRGVDGGGWSSGRAGGRNGFGVTSYRRLF